MPSVRYPVVILGVLLAVPAAFGACSSKKDVPAPITGGGNGGSSYGGTGGGTGGTGGHKDSGTDAAGADAGGTDGGGAAGADSGAAGSDSGAGGTGGSAGAPADSGPPAHCSNGQVDPGETDTDCGGVCAPCAVGLHCGLAADCTSGVCDPATRTCKAPVCTDQVKNGSETDVDCGGLVCTARCADGKNCLVPGDCQSGVCNGTPSTCKTPTCLDGVKNGNESDVDCGASCPSKCNRGQLCKTSPDCASNNCVNGQCDCPTNMVSSPSGTFCIDKYEVTNADYNVFLKAPNPPALLPECQWKPGTTQKYTPSANWPPLVGTYQNGGEEDVPVRDIDWCDAYAYCEWVGKRLCGKIGGGSNATTDYANSQDSQWYAACSAQGANTYPYGAAYDSQRCNGAAYSINDAGVGGPLPYTRFNNIPNKCQGGYVSLYDMSGNVAEWEDSCDASTGETDQCHVRGGSYLDADPTALACGASTELPRNSRTDGVGFRCCLD